MQVFLSYADADRHAAKEIAGLLEKSGLKVWSADEQLMPGENAASKVGQALEESEAMVVLVSPQAMQSSWVRRDIEFALGTPQYRGRLIPVIVKPTEEMPWILKKFPNIRLGRRVADTGREIANYVKQGFELTPA